MIQCTFLFLVFSKCFKFFYNFKFTEIHCFSNNLKMSIINKNKQTFFNQHHKKNTRKVQMLLVEALSNILTYCRSIFLDFLTNITEKF